MITCTTLEGLGVGINAYKYILEALGAQDMAAMLLRIPDNIKY